MGMSELARILTTEKITVITYANQGGGSGGAYKVDLS